MLFGLVNLYVIREIRNINLRCDHLLITKHNTIYRDLAGYITDAERENRAKHKQEITKK